jgi:hypothetical protein
MYLESVDLEYTHIPDLPYLARFKQFHLACVLIEVIPQGDAVATAPGVPHRWGRPAPVPIGGRSLAHLRNGRP